MPVKRKVQINDLGMRIGESHPRARLTDAECEQLILDRGPEDNPVMSYSQLALKWGISKPSVRDILKGRRRGQIGPTVDRPQSKRIAAKKVQVRASIPLHLRAKYHRLGGCRWLAEALESAELHTPSHRDVGCKSNAHGALSRTPLDVCMPTRGSEKVGA